LRAEQFEPVSGTALRLEVWLETVKAARAPKTYRAYEQLVRVHIAPALGRQHLHPVSDHAKAATTDQVKTGHLS
jgi:hypothetical protein